METNWIRACVCVCGAFLLSAEWRHLLACVWSSLTPRKNSVLSSYHLQFSEFSFECKLNWYEEARHNRLWERYFYFEIGSLWKAAVERQETNISKTLAVPTRTEQNSIVALWRLWKTWNQLEGRKLRCVKVITVNWASDHSWAPALLPAPFSNSQSKLFTPRPPSQLKYLIHVCIPA